MNKLAVVPASIQAVVSRKGVATIFGVAALSFAFASPASASTTITRWQTTETFTDVASDDCRGIDNGTLEGTDVSTFRVVETFDPQGASTGFHVSVVEQETLTFAFPDGSYATGEATSRRIINFSEDSGVLTFTAPHVDQIIVYTPDGQVMEHTMFHEILHVTRAGDNTFFANVERRHFSLNC